MRVEKTAFPEVLVLQPLVHRDDRGFFLESFNQVRFREVTGVSATFVQDNHSKSAQNVLRGLHYQLPPRSQGKLVRVVAGSVFDVVVDVRRSSETFGEWWGTTMDAITMSQLWIPAGFAHGFAALEDDTEILYKTTDFYSSDDERVINWADPRLGIEWPIPGPAKVSDKDASAPSLSEAEVFD